MAKIGYARVGSTGQSLKVQLEKLKSAGCERIFQDKRSGVTALWPQFNFCWSTINEGDTLIVTKLDRLARSVSNLAEISERLFKDRITLIVIDQSIDTSTTTGRSMFTLLPCIAEFENELRIERQREGIDRAKTNGVKFGRPITISDELGEKISKRKGEGAKTADIMKEFNLSRTSFYRCLALAKKVEVTKPDED